MLLTKRLLIFSFPSDVCWFHLLVWWVKCLTIINTVFLSFFFFLKKIICKNKRCMKHGRKYISFLHTIHTSRLTKREKFLQKIPLHLMMLMSVDVCLLCKWILLLFGNKMERSIKKEMLMLFIIIKTIKFTIE